MGCLHRAQETCPESSHHNVKLPVLMLSLWSSSESLTLAETQAGPGAGGEPELVTQ